MNEMLGCDDKVDDDVGTGEGWTTPGIRSIIARRQTEGSPRVLQVLREFYKQAFLHYIQYVYGLRKEAYRAVSHRTQAVICRRLFEKVVRVSERTRKIREISHWVSHRTHQTTTTIIPTTPTPFSTHTITLTVLVAKGTERTQLTHNTQLTQLIDINNDPSIPPPPPPLSLEQRSSVAPAISCGSRRL